MKLDCPHCRKSLGGKFLRWYKIGNSEQFRNCPICGGEIEFRIHPEELATGAIAIAVAIYTGYRIHSEGRPLLHLTIPVAVLLAAYAVSKILMRDKQRYVKGRNS